MLFYKKKKKTIFQNFRELKTQDKIRYLHGSSQNLNIILEYRWKLSGNCR